MQSRQPSHHGPILFLLFLHYLLLTRAQQNVSCFFPNGITIADEASKNDFYAACPTSAGNDGSYMCCKTSYPFNDVCNDNGLCARQNDASLGEQQGLLRSTCTDPTWTSPSCLKLCITGLGKCSTRPAAKGGIKVWRTALTTSMADYLGNVANATEQFVKQCDDGSWCCEAQTPPLNDQNVLNSSMQNQVNACCSQGKGVFINNGKVTDVNPNGTATSVSATAAATQSPSSATPTPPPPHHSNTGAIAGGVVGGVAGLVLIVAATFYFRRMKRNHDSMQEGSSGQEIRGASEHHEMHEKEWLNEKDGNQRFETDGTQVASGRSGPYEM